MCVTINLANIKGTAKPLWRQVIMLGLIFQKEMSI